MKIRRLNAQDRGPSDPQISWLQGHHSLSFGSYVNRDWVQHGQLRVFNHDIVAPSSGFAPHPHNDMEIVTIILRGSLEHTDNMGNKRQIHAGQIQAMGAGTGVVHSEMNPTSDQSCELFQIWVFPESKDLDPFYRELNINDAPSEGPWRWLVHPERPQSLQLRQNAVFAWGQCAAGEQHSWKATPSRPNLWLHVIEGQIRCQQQLLGPHDALAIEDAQDLEIAAETASQLLIIES